MGAAQQNSPLPSPDANNIIYITATPPPATALPSASPSPSPIPPSPSPFPAQLQQQAEQFAENGYWEEAATLYRRLLQFGTGIAAQDRAFAAFRLGQVTLRAGFFQQAADALTLHIVEFPQSTRLAQAHFLRGDAFLGISQWDAAIADLQRYLLLRPGLMDSYVYERIADAQLALGQADAALADYERAIQARRSLVPLLILREKLAQIYINLERYQDAIAQYDAILAVARNAPYRANIAYSAAQTALAADDSAAASQRLRTIFEQYPSTATAWKALEQLNEVGSPYSGLQRGKAAYTAGDYQAAIDAFNEFTSSNGLDAIPAELFLLLGRAYRQIGNSAAATIAFQAIIDQYPTDPLFGDALLERGRTRFLAGDSPGAIEAYLAIADTYPTFEQAAGEALWRAAYLYGTNGETMRSREVFMRLADTYPQHELTTNGLFNAASAALRQEEWAVAENIYARIASLSQGEYQAAAYLWMGRIAQRNSDQARADEAFSLAVAAAPDSYFAARAGDFQRNIPPFQAPSTMRFSFDDTSERAATEQWLRATFAIETPGALRPLSPQLQQDPRMIRSQELLAVGAYTEAANELDDLLDSVRANGDALGSYQLAVHLRELGMVRESVIAAADVIIAAGVGTLDAPTYLARLRFPAAYIDIIQPATAARAVDPLLVLALIRQESLFNTNATAAAGEVGLMQVIPSTGKYIAEELQWPNYQHSDLFRPYVGIAFGTFYIDEQLDLFDQNAIAALAAYNAGPGRALDWHALAGGDPDLFMTAITIESTRGYVQYIYRNYNIYRALYGGQ